ncbi:MAG TPA: hypothetical protein VIO57_12925, partial [Chloroflexota bacterium]
IPTAETASEAGCFQRFIRFWLLQCDQENTETNDRPVRVFAENSFLALVMVTVSVSPHAVVFS